MSLIPWRGKGVFDGVLERVADPRPVPPPNLHPLEAGYDIGLDRSQCFAACNGEIVDRSGPKPIIGEGEQTCQGRSRNRAAGTRLAAVTVPAGATNRRPTRHPVPPRPNVTADRGGLGQTELNAGVVNTS